MIARAVFIVSLLWAALANAGVMEDFKRATKLFNDGDYQVARMLFEELAEKNIPGAQIALGAIYLEGKGVSKNYQIALHWYRKAAEQGHPLAQYEIGAMYDAGLGVIENKTEAAKWFRRSANQGYGKAQINLGAMYYSGEGVPVSIEDSFKWFAIAARGDGFFVTQDVKVEAIKRRDALAKRIGASQAIKLQREADTWKPTAEAAAFESGSRIAKSEGDIFLPDNSKQVENNRTLIDALNNLHAEIVNCAAYYSVVKQCVGPDRDQTLFENTGKIVEALISMSHKVGSSIQMSEDAMLARLQLSIQSMKDLTRNDCVNISSLLVRHAQRCKQVTERADTVLDEYMKQK